MLRIKKVLLLCSGICSGFGISGCASLHHVQIGEMNPGVYAQAGQASPGSPARMVRFEHMESATGLNVREAGNILKSVSKSAKIDRAANTASDFYEALTFGPRTGEVVFNDTFPDVLPTRIRQSCPKGRVTGLMVTRETAKYPVVSGEIVRVTGYCVD